VLWRADAWVVQVAQNGYGVDISGHTPEHLRTVDKFLGERFRERLMQEPERHPDAVIALGSYLGEVFVRNLGGWWHFPDSFQMIALYLSWNLAKRTERYCYVMVHGQRIYVFGAARAGIQRTSREFSLHEFYQGWARYFQSQLSPANSR